MRRLLPALAIACAAVLVAAPAGAGEADDQQIAEDVSLTLDDFPDDWEAEPSSDLGEPSGIDECEALDDATATALEVAAYEETPLFVDPDDPSGETTVEGAVFVFPKAKAAKRYFRPYADDAARECFQAVGDATVEGYPESEVGTSDLRVSAGDAAVGYRLEIEGTNDAGVTDSVVLDLIVVRQGRAVVNLGGQGPEEPPDLDELIDTVLERLDDEL
ncbi:MAG TPA: hypothetical protein VF152_13305 [Acidimicrobiia bacterium]